jgi:hypothetical protein
MAFPGVRKFYAKIEMKAHPEKACTVQQWRHFFDAIHQLLCRKYNHDIRRNLQIFVTDKTQSSPKNGQKPLHPR